MGPAGATQPRAAPLLRALSARHHATGPAAGARRRPHRRHSPPLLHCSQHQQLPSLPLLPLKAASSPAGARRDVSVAAAAAGGAAAAPQPAGDTGIFVKKVACLSLMFFGATIVYTILQSLRDALIVTSCGAEALPLISAFGVLPASLVFVAYHAWLVSSLDSNTVFYFSLLPFAAFFSLFAGLLLPHADALHPTELAASVCKQLPDSLGCFVRVMANWSFTLFFILGELWGTVAISLLFWGVADDACSVDEAKEVYGKLGILANLGLIAAGAATRFVSVTLARSDTEALQILTAFAVAMTGLMMAVKRYLDAAVMPHVAGRKEAAKAAHTQQKQQQQKQQQQQADGGGKKASSPWQLFAASPRIRNLTLMVMGYTLTHKLFGFCWKAQVQLMHPSKAAYATVMADVASFTGAATVALMLCSKWLFQFLGWRGAALATPLVMLASGVVFFASSLQPAFAGGAGAGGLPQGALLAALLALGPAAGIVAQVFGRAAKYSLFDPSKEMVFINLDKAEKESGKATVDVLGAQVGKTGGSLLMQVALLSCGSMAGALPITALAYLAMCAVWLHATLGLACEMGAPEDEQVVLATIDEASALQPPAPGKLLVPSAAGGDNGSQSEAEQAIKETMQSHFD